MKKALITVLTIIMLFSALPFSVSAELNTEDIIILYENDVHCAVDGYAKLSAMKNELLETYANVGVVSSGDYIQGASLGVVSRGEYIIKLINLVGYDALALGNHEFDYQIDRLKELVSMMETKPVCSNFQKIGEEKTVFDAYSIVTYGETKVAYVGITTPATLVSSSPAQFKDENGEYIYTFNPTTLGETVQKAVDSARAEGADYVVALSHSGDKELNYTVMEVASSTEGIDVFLDGHSHSVIEKTVLKNKAGEDVIVTSTGEKFGNIGKLTISNGEITTELIPTETYTKTDSKVVALIDEINNEVSSKGNRVVGVAEVDLLAYDKDGNRLVRKSETNLGDLCADAYRYVTGADIGYVNGGGVRASIDKGEITFNDLLTLYPFNNRSIVAKVKGQAIKDMLERAMMMYPEEEGSFPHLSGLTFSFNASIPSSVVLDENENFVSVNGEYRVYDIKVFNKETNQYEPMDLEKEYTFSTHNYFIPDLGGGMVMFKDAEIVQDYGTLDVEVVEKYITEYLNGVVGDEYKEVTPNITFVTDEEPTQPGDGNMLVAWGIGACVSLAFLAIVAQKKRVK